MNHIKETCFLDKLWFHLVSILIPMPKNRRAIWFFGDSCLQWQRCVLWQPSHQGSYGCRTRGALPGSYAWHNDGEQDDGWRPGWYLGHCNKSSPFPVAGINPTTTIPWMLRWSLAPPFRRPLPPLPRPDIMILVWLVNDWSALSFV